MKIGSRERIVLGVIGGVLAIGGLHMMAYKDSAAAYKQARQDFENAKNEYVGGGAPRSWADIHKFGYETINKELEFQRLLLNSGVAAPARLKEVFAVVPPKADGSLDFEAIGEFNRELNVDVLQEIEKLRDSLQNTKLTFLEEYEDPRVVDGLNRSTAEAYLGNERLRDFNKRWAILKELPSSLTSGTADVSDLLRKLNDTNALIESAPQGSALLFQKEREYAAQLAVFGIPLARRDDMKEKLGEWPTYFMTLNRVEVVRKAVPRQELGILSDDEYTKHLKRLFRLDWKDADGAYAYRQGLALLELLKLADANKVKEVTEVKLWGKMNLKWPPKEERDKEAAAAAGAAGAPGAMPPGAAGGFLDETAFFDESMMGMGDEFLGTGGFGGAAAQARAEEDEKLIMGAANPIEMEVVGSNSTVMAFAYAATNSDKAFELDSIRFQAIPGDEDAVKARLIFKCTTMIKTFELVFQDDLEKTIADLERQKNRIAQLNAASELAAAEGFVPDPNNAVEVTYYGEDGRPAPGGAAPVDPNIDPMM